MSAAVRVQLQSGRAAVRRPPRLFLADVRRSRLPAINDRTDSESRNPGHDGRPFPSPPRNPPECSRYLVDAARLVSRDPFIERDQTERYAIYTGRVRLRAVAARTAAYLSRGSVISAAELCAYTAIFNLLRSPPPRSRTHARIRARHTRERARLSCVHEMRSTAPGSDVSSGPVPCAARWGAPYVAARRHFVRREYKYNLYNGESVGAANLIERKDCCILGEITGI